MILKFSLMFLLAIFCHAVQGASILALFSTLSFADHYVFRGYVNLLAQRGHSVVVMTPYPGHFQIPELERIVELDVSEASASYWEEFRALVTNTDDYYPNMKAINEFSLKLAISQLKSKQMTALFINPNIKFDLVIAEAEVPLLYAVADKYKAPLAAITTGSGTITMYESKGCPTHPLVYPDVNTLNYRDLNVWQKFTEISRFFHTRREYYNNYLPLSQIAAEKILGSKKDLLEIEQDIDLLLVSGSPALIGNRPSSSAVGYVDRLQVKPGISLAPELKTIVDSAQKGVVFFSLGALQESEQLSLSVLQTLADSFRELPYLVLWKIGNTTMFEKPNNVLAQAWFPQQELLAHPNVKAFITHGGPRSLEEAVFYEVPIIGFPIVKSRKTFIKEVTRHGAGEIVDPYSLDKEAFKKTIEQVVSDEKYKKAMSAVKVKVQDPVTSGPDHAIWLTEYVIRQKGARHLRSPAVEYSFLDYYTVDVAVFFTILILILTIAFLAVLRYIVKRIKAKIYGEPDLNGKFKAL